MTRADIVVHTTGGQLFSFEIGDRKVQSFLATGRWVLTLSSIDISEYIIADAFKKRVQINHESSQAENIVNSLVSYFETRKAPPLSDVTRRKLGHFEID